MKPETVAQLMNIRQGQKAIKTGQELCRSAQTPEEIEAARAYKRVVTGTIVLVLALVVVLGILTPICMSHLELEEGISRIGVVQEDYSVRYIDNVAVYISLEELEAQDYGLRPGDKVKIYFSLGTEEPTSGYPYDIFEAHQSTSIGILLGSVALMIVVLLVYAIVICRYTPFGSAWYRYCRKQQEKEEDIPLRAKIVIYAVSAAITLVICWPSIQSIVENVTKGNELRDSIQSAQEAADEASDMAEDLETVGQNSDVQDAVSDAGEAAGNIGSILDDLNGNE